MAELKFHEELTRVVTSYQSLDKNVKYAEEIFNSKTLLSELLKKRAKLTLFNKVKKQECIVRSYQLLQEAQTQEKAAKNFNEKLTIFASQIESYFSKEVNDKWDAMKLLPKIAKLKDKVAKNEEEFTLIQMHDRYIEDAKVNFHEKYNDLLMKQAIMSYWEIKYLPKMQLA